MIEQILCVILVNSEKFEQHNYVKNVNCRLLFFEILLKGTEILNS